jgi:DNA-binding MarR family transcriptional regulator
MPRERHIRWRRGEGTQGTFTLPATLTRDVRHLEEAGLIERIQGFRGKGINLTPEGVEFTRELKEKV